MPAVPAATPRVLPMRNAAPGQVEQVSQTVARAGAQAQQLGNTIGDRVQDTFDDASARNAETSFLSSSNDVLTRYTHTLGKDAIDGYDGATQEIVTAKQTARDSLTNPVQQHLFDAMAVPRLVEFGKTLSDHHFQQNIQYGTQAANDRSDSLVQLSANGYADWQRPDGKYTTNKLMAVHEAQQAALLLGQPPDSPQAKALVRTKTTALAQGVLTRMMDNEQYSEAQHYYDQAMANGEIDERSAEMLGNAVMEGHNAQKGALLMSDARQAALGAQAAAPRPSGANDAAYQQWLQANHLHEDPDYDAYGAFKAGLQPADNGHMGDQYKLPTHPTFSSESVYANKPGAPPAGEWVEGADKKWTFKATETNVRNAGGVKGLKAYFDQVEPGNTVQLPDGTKYVGTPQPGEQSWEDMRGPAGTVGVTQQRLQPVSIGSITETMGAPRPGNRTHDGIDIAVPVGTNVQAPANGTVSKVWDDDKFGGGLSMEISYPNGNVEGFAHLSAVNYKPGQQVSQGSIVAQTGKSGNATGPVLHWAMKDKDGNWIDPRSSVDAPKPTDTFTTPEQLERGLAYIDASDATQRVKDIAITKLRAQYGLARELQTQQYQQVKQQAVDYYFNNGQSIDGLPAAIRASLKPQDLAAFADRPDRTKSDVDTLYGWVTNRDTLTVPNVKAAYAQGKLSDAGLLEWTQRAQKQDVSAEKVRAASIDTKQFTDILAANQLPLLAQPNSPETKLQRIDLQTAATDEVDILQQKAGRLLTRDEKGKVMRDLVVDKVYTPGWLTAGKPKPVALLTPKEMENATVYVAGQPIKLSHIPPKYVQAATLDARATGVEPTQANIAAWWVKNGKPVR
jgi:murein DD-endopeptidase MepM/ murein hydrolase activator NlpD